MSFFRSSQAERDAAFLEAVSKHKFKKAEKLVRKGANPRATDAEGNTALHKMTGTVDYLTSSTVDDFICFLLKNNLDINTRNAKGQTCLHLVGLANHGNESYYEWGDEYGRSRCTGEEMLRFLINRGALINEQDNAGNTIVHIAAAAGAAGIIDKCLLMDLSLIGVQNGEGLYPHDSALSGVIKHVNLAENIRKKFDTYHPGRQEKKKEIAAPIVTMTPYTVEGNTEWCLLEPDQVAHVSLRKALGYKLTEIFNFGQRTCTRIAHNLDTKVEAIETKGFDDFADKSAFVRARAELLRLGGAADEAAIHGQKLDKSRNTLGKDV